eukprot:g5038.t1
MMHQFKKVGGVRGANGHARRAAAQREQLPTDEGNTNDDVLVSKASTAFLDQHRHEDKKMSATSSSSTSFIGHGGGPYEEDGPALDPYGVETLNSWYVHLSWNRSTLHTDALTDTQLQLVLREYSIGVCKHQLWPKPQNDLDFGTVYDGYVCHAVGREHLFYPMGLGKDWSANGGQLIDLPSPDRKWPEWFVQGRVCDASCTVPQYAAAASLPPSGTTLGGPLAMKQWAYAVLSEAWCPNLHNSELLRRDSGESATDFDRRRNVLQRACLKMPGWLTTEEMRKVLTKYFASICTQLGKEDTCMVTGRASTRKNVVPFKLGIKGWWQFDTSMPHWLPPDAGASICYKDSNTTNATNTTDTSTTPKPAKPCHWWWWLIPVAFLALVCCCSVLCCCSAAGAEKREGDEAASDRVVASTVYDKDADAAYLTEKEHRLNAPVESASTWQPPPPAGALASAHHAVAVANLAVETLISDPNETESALVGAGFSPAYAKKLAEAIDRIPKDPEHALSSRGLRRKRKEEEPRSGPPSSPSSQVEKGPDGQKPFSDDIFHIVNKLGRESKGLHLKSKAKKRRGSPDKGGQGGEDRNQREEAPIPLAGIDYAMPLPDTDADLELLYTFGLWTPAETTTSGDEKEHDLKAMKNQDPHGASSKIEKAKLLGKASAAAKSKGRKKDRNAPADDDGTRGGTPEDHSTEDPAAGANLRNLVSPGEMGDAEHVRDFLANQWKKKMYRDKEMQKLLEEPPELDVCTRAEVEKTLVDSGFSMRSAKLIAPIAQKHGKLDHDMPPIIFPKPRTKDQDGKEVVQDHDEPSKSGAGAGGNIRLPARKKGSGMKKVALSAQKLAELPLEKMDPEDRERFWNNFRVAVLPPAEDWGPQTSAALVASKMAGFTAASAAAEKKKSKGKTEKHESLLDNVVEKDDFDRKAVETAQVVLSKCRLAQSPRGGLGGKIKNNDSSHSPGKDDTPQHYLDTAEAERVLKAQGFKSAGTAKKLAKLLDEQLQERALVEGRAAEIALAFLKEGGANDLHLEETLPRCAKHILNTISKEHEQEALQRAGGAAAAAAAPLQLTQEDAERIGTKAIAEWKLQAEVQQFVRKKEPDEDFDISKGFDVAAAAGMSYELADAFTANDLDDILKVDDESDEAGLSAADGAEIKEFVESNFVRQQRTPRRSKNAGLPSNESNSSNKERQLHVVDEIMKPSHVRSFLSAVVAQRARKKLPTLLEGGRSRKDHDKDAKVNAAAGAAAAAAEVDELAAELDCGLRRCAVFEAGQELRGKLRKKIAQKLAGHLVKRGSVDAGATERICFNENGPLLAVLAPGEEYEGQVTGGRCLYTTQVAKILPGFQLADRQLRDFAKSGATTAELKLLAGFRNDHENDYVVVKDDEHLVSDAELQRMVEDRGSGSDSQSSQIVSASNKSKAGGASHDIERVNVVQNFRLKTKRKRLDQIKDEMKKKKPDVAALAARGRLKRPLSGLNKSQTQELQSDAMSMKSQTITNNGSDKDSDHSTSDQSSRPEQMEQMKSAVTGV